MPRPLPILATGAPVLLVATCPELARCRRRMGTASISCARCPVASLSNLGGVAQLGEHLPCKQDVGGSIPPASTNPSPGATISCADVPRGTTVASLAPGVVLAAEAPMAVRPVRTGEVPSSILGRGPIHAGVAQPVERGICTPVDAGPTPAASPLASVATSVCPTDGKLVVAGVPLAPVAACVRSSEPLATTEADTLPAPSDTGSPGLAGGGCWERRRHRSAAAGAFPPGPGTPPGGPAGGLMEQGGQRPDPAAPATSDPNALTAQGGHGSGTEAEGRRAAAPRLTGLSLGSSQARRTPAKEEPQPARVKPAPFQRDTTTTMRPPSMVAREGNAGQRTSGGDHPEHRDTAGMAKARVCPGAPGGGERPAAAPARGTTHPTPVPPTPSPGRYAASFAVHFSFVRLSQPVHTGPGDGSIHLPGAPGPVSLRGCG